MQGLIEHSSSLSHAIRTRGEARDYGHRGHHQFLAGSSTQQTVMNIIFTLDCQNFVGVGGPQQLGIAPPLPRADS